MPHHTQSQIQLAKCGLQMHLNQILRHFCRAIGARSVNPCSSKGEIPGSESLDIEGTVEGSVNLPDDRVTVGRNGRVSANIAAREIVVLGEIVGNCEAIDHFDIRSEASLCGDVVVSRISVEDGAFLTGSIDIRQESALEAVEQDQVEFSQVNLPPSQISANSSKDSPPQFPN